MKKEFFIASTFLLLEFIKSFILFLKVSQKTLHLIMNQRSTKRNFVWSRDSIEIFCRITEAQTKVDLGKTETVCFVILIVSMLWRGVSLVTTMSDLSWTRREYQFRHLLSHRRITPTKHIKNMRQLSHSIFIYCPQRE